MQEKKGDEAREEGDSETGKSGRGANIDIAGNRTFPLLRYWRPVECPPYQLRPVESCGGTISRLVQSLPFGGGGRFAIRACCSCMLSRGWAACLLFLCGLLLRFLLLLFPHVCLAAVSRVKIPSTGAVRNLAFNPCVVSLCFPLHLLYASRPVSAPFLNLRLLLLFEILKVLG